jgi:succinate dehydrogenase / fumarate reductase iron-sulfur subunit
MCGCCVEVCPAFYKKKEFPGMATLVAIGNLINTDNVNMYEKKIKNNFMDSCYRDMNCEKVCPMKLHISENFASILKMIENKQDG